MKRNKTGPRGPEQVRLEDEDINKLEKGITKALLEKYKSKIIRNIDTLNEREIPRRVA